LLSKIISLKNIQLVLDMLKISQSGLNFRLGGLSPPLAPPLLLAPIIAETET